MTTKRSKVWNLATRRYYAIRPVKCEWQDELNYLWLNYHHKKTRTKNE